MVVTSTPKPSPEKRTTSPTRKMSAVTPNAVAVFSAEADRVVIRGIGSSSSHSNFGFSAGSEPILFRNTVSGATFGSSSSTPKSMPRTLLSVF